MDRTMLSATFITMGKSEKIKQEAALSSPCVVRLTSCMLHARLTETLVRSHSPGLLSSLQWWNVPEGQTNRVHATRTCTYKSQANGVSTRCGELPRASRPTTHTPIFTGTLESPQSNGVACRAVPQWVVLVDSRHNLWATSGTRHGIPEKV